MLIIKLVNSKITDDLIPLNKCKNVGSVIRFNGCIRKMEDEKEISGIYYEYYEGMAELELERLAKSTMERFKIESVICLHRIGFVPVGDSAILLEIHSKHRNESIDALKWFMDKLKVDVPIWKKIDE